jgi:hypothetical protein
MKLSDFVGICFYLYYVLIAIFLFISFRHVKELKNRNWIKQVLTLRVLTFTTIYIISSSVLINYIEPRLLFSSAFYFEDYPTSLVIIYPLTLIFVYSIIKIANLKVFDYLNQNQNYKNLISLTIIVLSFVSIILILIIDQLLVNFILVILNIYVLAAYFLIAYKDKLEDLICSN